MSETEAVYADLLTDVGEGISVRWNGPTALMSGHLLASFGDTGQPIGRVFADDEAEAWEALPERIANFVSARDAADKALAEEDTAGTEKVATAKERAIADILSRSAGADKATADKADADKAAAAKKSTTSKTAATPATQE